MPFPRPLPRGPVPVYAVEVRLPDALHQTARVAALRDAEVIQEYPPGTTEGDVQELLEGVLLRAHGVRVRWEDYGRGQVAIPLPSSTPRT